MHRYEIIHWSNDDEAGVIAEAAQGIDNVSGEDS